MLCRTRSLLLAGLLAPLLLSGCNNTLNPLCTSARPAPLIGSISPSTMTFAQVQQGVELVVNGSNFVSSTEVMINSTPLGASVVSSSLLKVKVSSDVISGPGQVKVMVQTPSGNTGDLGCTSGGKSSVLVLTVH
jgi:IPT/TIG domain